MEGATHFILQFEDIYGGLRYTTLIEPIQDLPNYIRAGDTYKYIAIWWIKALEKSKLKK